MANYVMNRIHFDTDEDTAREIFAAIQKDANGNDSETKRKSGPGTIDFNKLIPVFGTWEKLSSLEEAATTQSPYFWPSLYALVENWPERT